MALNWLGFLLLPVLTAVLSYPDPAPIHPPSTADRIRKVGYIVEEHEVITEDGYILKLFRIPHGRNHLSSRKPLLLQHGVLCTSDIWVINELNGLAYVLAEAGYDVWLGNNRGNTYCRKHIKYNSKEKEFWNFSFHELGYYDLPATIDYILEVTGQQSLSYIGHSQGTAIFFVMSSTRIEYNKKIKVMAAFAPIAYLDKTRGTVRSLSRLSHFIIISAKFLNYNYLFDRSRSLAVLDHILCNVQWEYCNLFIGSIVGYDNQHLDKGLIPYLADITPAAASLKQLMHFNQLVSSGKFTYYDYEQDNVLKYNSSFPPEYNISAITTPILLYYGTNDFISNVEEVKRLYVRLSRVDEIKEIDSFNHLDFMWAKDAKDMLYNYLLKKIDTYYN